MAQPQYIGRSRRSEWDVCINADAEVGVGVNVGGTSFSPEGPPQFQWPWQPIIVKQLITEMLSKGVIPMMRVRNRVGFSSTPQRPVTSPLTTGKLSFYSATDRTMLEYPHYIFFPSMLVLPFVH